MGLEEKLTLIDRADITEGGFLLKGALKGKIYIFQTSVNPSPILQHRITTLQFPTCLM